MKKTLFILFLVTFQAVVLKSQSFQIMKYGIDEGLCHESTYNITQDSSGFVWITTVQGICRFDGKYFYSSFPGDTISNDYASSTLVDRQGRVWFGHSEGSISVFDKGQMRSIAANNNKQSKIVALEEDSEGNIMAMTQRNGLLIISDDYVVDTISAPFNRMFPSTMHLTQDGNLFVGGYEGISLFVYNSDSLRYDKAGSIPNLPSFVEIQIVINGVEDDTYWIGTVDEGLFRMRGTGNDPTAFTVEKMGVEQGLGYSRINSLLIDNSGYLWVSDNGAGVIRFTIDEDNGLSAPMIFNETGGLQEEYIKDIMQDDEGNIWFASQSKGVSILRDQAFTFMDVEGNLEVPEITAISIGAQYMWFGSLHGGLARVPLSNPTSKDFFDSRNGLPDDKVTALWQDADMNLYIGFESSGAYVYQADKKVFRSYFLANNRLGNTVNSIEGNASYIWIATNEGIYEINREDNSQKQYNTSTRLDHNVINDLMLDSKGRLWVATRTRGVFTLNDTVRYTIDGGNPKLEFVDLAEDQSGNIWAASLEDGVFCFMDEEIKVYQPENGLLKRYTYAIDIDHRGYIWVGHKLGLSKINPATGNITVFGKEMGFTSDIQRNAIAGIPGGMLFFGTNKGLILYDVNQAKVDTVPPRLNITSLNISDSLYSATEDIHLPYGRYKITFDFIGINLSNPDQVTYRYKLKGFDDWSEWTHDGDAKYTRIEDGDYTFMLAACDGNGNCTGEVEMINISVKIPIWKAWWFILAMVLLVIFSVYFYIKYRERKQKALQEYLEQQLDMRTREVIHQKEEIEIKNRDITDSINYAQRIQASILPPIQRLHHTFSGSFVFYQPRDIVSGDFYWYDKLDDERFMIVCADSTGHGVPGAFMSMIGTTLIKDICLRKDVKTPSDVLKTLDEEVRTALNQNVESDGSNDGMDIIVAEINLKTSKFMVSSAMRPVILYKDGEQIYVKGSRSSVGGQLDDTVIEKEFTNEEFDLKKGDIIYMFSDGYPDQFGGPLGRKFKMVRLKNLLRDIHDKPMDEQYNYVKSNFFLWKEDLEQVDDVLFMGVKI